MIVDDKKIEVKDSLREVLDVQRQFLEIFTRHPNWTFLYDAYLELNEIKNRYESYLAERL